MDDETRDEHGRFRPGFSGNPAGKRPGTLNHATRLARWLDDADTEQVARAMFAEAIKGRVAAARLLLDRLDPRPRGRTHSLGLPAGATLKDGYGAVFAHLATGAITPGEALTMSQVLERQGDGPAWEAARTAALTRAVFGAHPGEPPREALHPASKAQDPAPATPSFARRRARG